MGILEKIAEIEAEVIVTKFDFVCSWRTRFVVPNRKIS